VIPVGDLQRHPLAAPAFWIGGRVLGFDRVTLHDGVTSIKRGFSRSELLELIRAKAEGGELPERRDEEPQVVDLMQALRESVERTQKARGSRKTA